MNRLGNIIYLSLKISDDIKMKSQGDLVLLEKYPISMRICFWWFAVLNVAWFIRHILKSFVSRLINLRPSIKRETIVWPGTSVWCRRTKAKKINKMRNCARSLIIKRTCYGKYMEWPEGKWTKTRRLASVLEQLLVTEGRSKGDWSHGICYRRLRNVRLCTCAYDILYEYRSAVT